jgi:hypothetical protein
MKHYYDTNLSADSEVTSTSDIALAVMTGHRPFRREKVIRVGGSDIWNPPSGFNFTISREWTTPLVVLRWLM